MHKISYGAASVVLAVLALTSGCGQQPAATAGGRSPMPPASPSPAATCGGAAMAASRGGTVTLGTSDNGKSLCVRRGMTVLVVLQGTAASQWSPIRASSTALLPRANGRLMLARGVTGASFAAARQGVSVIVSSRAVCPRARPKPSAKASSGGVTCDARESYHVTLMVVK